MCPPRLVHLSQDAFILFDRINGFIASQFFGCNPLLLKTGLQFMERLVQLFELLKIYCTQTNSKNHQVPLEFIQNISKYIELKQ